MQIDSYTHQVSAVLISRVFLGMLFFFQGYDAVFRIKIPAVIESIRYPLASHGIPLPMITLGAYYTSFIELVGGGLLILGFLKYYVLYLLGFNLLLASYAMGVSRPLWDMQFIFPRLLLLLFLLLAPSHWDMISADYLISYLKLKSIVLGGIFS